MSDREPESVAFERARIAPGRRRVDPILIGVVVVVIGLAAAVVKPWQATEGLGSAADGTASASPLAAAPASQAPASERPAAAAIPQTPPIAWPRAAAAIRPHPEWGIRALVRDPEPASADDPTNGLIERWWALEAAPTPGRPATAGALEAGDGSVLAVGLTFPPDRLPLDVRLWKATAAGGWTWLDAAALEASPSGGAYLFGPPIVDGIQLPFWPSGSYRAEILLGGAIQRVDVELVGGSEFGPDPGYGAGVAPPFGSAFAADLTAVTSGPFVTVDGVGVPVPGAGGDPIDPLDAWLDTVLKTGRVGVASEPRANGLGLLLSDGSTAMDATLRRLSADDGPAFEARRAVGLRFGTGTDRAPYVAFRAPGGLAFPAGLYAIDAEWTDAAGRQHATFHVELRPGKRTIDPPLLGAARAFAGSAEGDAVVIAGPDEGAALAPSLAVVPLRPGGNVGGGDVECAGDPALAAVRPTVIGLTHAVHDPPSNVSARLQFSAGRFTEVPLLVSPEVLPGLSLLAPANGDGLAPGIYRVTTGDGASGRHATFCLGTLVID